MKLARHLVPGDVPPAVRVEVLERRFVSRPGLHDRRNALAPSLIGNTDDDDVEHRRMRLQRGFDLFREDLLAAGVDAHGAAAEQRHRAVCFHDGVVAGHRVPPAVHRHERCRGLVGIFVVAQRDVATASHAPDHA